MKDRKAKPTSILYNPYYQKNVIKEHLEILLEKGEVAVGKLKSKLKDISHPFENKLQELIEGINKENYLQLFLTDYSSIYVAIISAEIEFQHYKEDLTLDFNLVVVKYSK